VLVSSNTCLQRRHRSKQKDDKEVTDQKDDQGVAWLWVVTADAAVLADNAVTGEWCLFRVAAAATISNPTPTSASTEPLDSDEKKKMEGKGANIPLSIL